jgi:LppX_LprAFG lipoprotein
MVRRLSIGVALFVLPVGAAACGGSGKGSSTSTGDAASAVQAAVAKTAKAGGEHAVLTASVGAAGQSVKLSGAGDFDSAKHVGKLHASISLGGVDTEIDEVLSGSTIYVSSPLFAALLPAGKTWLKVDLANPPASLGAYASALGTQDPAAALAQLKALTGVKATGTQTIGGVDATRYRGTVDVAKLPASTATAMQSAGVTFGPVDVWVGSDGYVHRVRVPTSASAGGQAAKTTLTMTLSHFGGGVSVSVPPASQTADASKVSIPGLGG